MNIEIEDNPKDIRLATSLLKQEKKNFVKFFKDGHIIFSWSYANMPGWDPDLIMHHLSIASKVKLVKQKQRKIDLKHN